MEKPVITTHHSAPENTGTTVYLNGSFLRLEEAAIPVYDRGFIFGDGIYEVIRVVEGRLFREEEHYMRMREGLEGLQINLPPQELERMQEASRELLSKNGHLSGEASLYIQVTRGAAWPRTHQFPEPAVPPTLYLSTSPFQPHNDLHETGVDAITLEDVRWHRCNLKTVNLLPNVLARQKALEAGVNSALMVRDGVITESPNANIFGVRDQVLYTFPLSNLILSGITRRVVIELAGELGIPVREEGIRETELDRMDELFFTGTTTDIQPVVKVNGRPIGTGEPGPMARKLQTAYRELLYD